MNIWKWTTPNGQWGLVKADDDDIAWFAVICLTGQAPEAVEWVREVTAP
jgi:hypothetical protein